MGEDDDGDGTTGSFVLTTLILSAKFE